MSQHLSVQKRQPENESQEGGGTLIRSNLLKMMAEVTNYVASDINFSQNCIYKSVQSVKSIFTSPVLTSL